MTTKVNSQLDSSEIESSSFPDVRKKQGNLHSLLTSYDKSKDKNLPVPPSDASLQLDSVGAPRERSSTLGSFRDRSFTFGSEFDMSIGFGELSSQTGGGGGIPTDIGNVNTVTTSTQDNVVSASSSSASALPQAAAPGTSPLSSPIIDPDQTNTESTVVKSDDGDKAKGNSELRPFPGVQYVNYSSKINNSNGQNMTTEDADSSMKTQSNNNNNTTSESGLGQSSTSGFLSGMFGNQNALRGHTPPTANPTSYEGAHFGKRMRSESISGRLRSMSDLEDRGIIDNKQKGVLKDLIIAGGDDSLQIALDKYEKGDTSALKEMLNSGIIQTKNIDGIDLMGDLDLDFLNMDDGYNDNDEASQRTATKSLPIPVSNQNNNNTDGNISGSNHGSGASTPKCRAESPSPATQPYDGIGELEFNGEYPNSSNEDNGFITQATNVTIPVPAPTITKPRSNSFLNDTQRLRANSLAFCGLLEEPGTEDQDPIGKWMDLIPEGRSKPIKKRAPQAVNGTLFNINTIQGSQVQTQTQNNEEKKLTRAETVAMKRREREEKRAMKEREKLLKKEQREREVRERKERKEMKKTKKSTQDLSPRLPTRKKKELDDGENDEGPKEVVSGTGRPRSLSDPNLSVRLDENGLMNVQGPPDWIGAYSPESRKIRIERFLVKRNHRVWVKKVKYDVRKNFADSRLRVKGRFVKKEDELLMRDLMSLT